MPFSKYGRPKEEKSRAETRAVLLDRDEEEEDEEEQGTMHTAAGGRQQATHWLY